MKKIISRILSYVLTAIIVVFVGITALAIISKPKNHGVAKVFDYSFMHILTDSMEPEYKVGVGIIVKDVDYHDLKINDDIAYAHVVSGTKIVIMHRIIDIDTKSEPYVFTTQGINLDSEQCRLGAKDCEPETNIAASNILGKVVSKSGALGFLLRTIQNSYVQLCLIIIPLAGVVIYAFINLIKSIKEKDQEPALEGASETPSEEGGSNDENAK